MTDMLLKSKKKVSLVTSKQQVRHSSVINNRSSVISQTLPPVIKNNGNISTKKYHAMNNTHSDSDDDDEGENIILDMKSDGAGSRKKYSCAKWIPLKARLKMFKRDFDVTRQIIRLRETTNKVIERKNRVYKIEDGESGKGKDYTGSKKGKECALCTYSFSPANLPLSVSYKGTYTYIVT